MIIGISLGISSFCSERIKEFGRYQTLALKLRLTPSRGLGFSVQAGSKDPDMTRTLNPELEYFVPHVLM